VPDAQIADNMMKKGKGVIADLFKTEEVWTVDQLTGEERPQQPMGCPPRNGYIFDR
jgi:hypothetical protein